MIRNVHCTELRQIIADILMPTIEKYRSTKKDQFFYEFDVEPTDDEIDDFIMSASYFDDIVRDFLFNGVGYWLLDDADVNIFKNNTKLCIEKWLKIDPLS